MYRLLRALAAFDVVKDLGDGEFELTSCGNFLRGDAPNSVRPLVLMYGSDVSIGHTGLTAHRPQYSLSRVFLWRVRVRG